MPPNKEHSSVEGPPGLAPLTAGQNASVGPDPLQQTLEYPKLRAELLRSLKVLMHPGRRGRLFGLLCVRVDAKDAVDALPGAPGVEQLLREAFHRLRSCVRTTDMIAHGEDGVFFALATDLQSEDELEIISDRMQRTCRQPYWIDGREIRSGLTCGGVASSEGASDPAILTEHAILAMQRAGNHGVPFEFFNRPAAHYSSAGALAPDKSDAAVQGSFELCFRPQFGSNLALSGASVAIQMPTALGKRARRPAPRFAGRGSKERGSNERIGDRVLRKVLFQARAWREMSLLLPAISIEIGANHLLNARFADEFLKLLHETDTPGSAIDLLLTEATTLTSLGSAQRTIAMLTEAGVKFGLSGFSLNAGTRLDLRKLPFSSLRVNCTSLFKVTSPRESLWLARSIVGVAHRCGLAFVGEDVDSAEQKEILLESGCDRFEGLLFSPALTTQEMEALLRKGN